MNMKLSNQGLSSKEEFKKITESIGFKDTGYYYRYNDYIIDLSYDDEYGFCDGSKWYYYEYNDLRHIEKEFKREIRSIKLKGLLG